MNRMHQFSTITVLIRADLKTKTRSISNKLFLNQPCYSAHIYKHRIMTIKKMLYAFVLPLLLFSGQLFAQERTVTGTVTDSAGGPVSNASVVVKGGKAAMTDIQTGVRQASTVEITKGLSAGDSIVITGVLFARPNSPVKIRSVKTLDQLQVSRTQ